MEQDNLEDLAFTLDLINLANGMGCHDAHCGPRTDSPEGDQLEAMMRDVLASAPGQGDPAGI